jgi:hypothetical protein
LSRDPQSRGASDLVDQAKAARERRYADDAAGAARRAADDARIDAELQAIAQEREALDRQRIQRENERQRLEAEAAAMAVERARVEEIERQERDAELEQLRQEHEAQREHLEAETARLAAESARLREVAAAEALREEELRRAVREIEENRRQAAAALDAMVEAKRKELAEIEQRLEDRALVVPKVGEPPVDPERGRPKARLRVAASVVLNHGAELIALPLVDVSLTGALISAQGRVLDQLPVGTELPLTLFANENADQQVDVVARVVRHREDTLAVDWSQNQSAAYAIGCFLDALSEGFEGRPPVEVQELKMEEIDQSLQTLAETIAPPPPPAPSKSRRKARLQLSASVLIDHSGVALTLPIRNISLTGALVETQGSLVGRLRIGSMLLLAVVANDDETKRTDLLARVVRHEPDATAIDWSQDKAAAYDLACLLESLAEARES